MYVIVFVKPCTAHKAFHAFELHKRFTPIVHDSAICREQKTSTDKRRVATNPRFARYTRIHILAILTWKKRVEKEEKCMLQFSIDVILNVLHFSILVRNN